MLTAPTSILVKAVIPAAAGQELHDPEAAELSPSLLKPPLPSLHRSRSGLALPDSTHTPVWAPLI